MRLNIVVLMKCSGECLEATRIVDNPLLDDPVAAILYGIIQWLEVSCQLSLGLVSEKDPACMKHFGRPSSATIASAAILQRRAAINTGSPLQVCCRIQPGYPKAKSLP